METTCTRFNHGKCRIIEITLEQDVCVQLPRAFMKNEASFFAQVCFMEYRAICIWKPHVRALVMANAAS